jgi:hypothetical protein
MKGRLAVCSSQLRYAGPPECRCGDSNVVFLKLPVLSSHVTRSCAYAKHASSRVSGTGTLVGVGGFAHLVR